MSPPKPDAVAKALSSNHDKAMPISPTPSTDKTLAPKKTTDSPGSKSGSSGKAPTAGSGGKTGSAPRLRKQKHAASSGTGDSGSTGNSAPPSKKQKVTPVPAKQAPVAKRTSAENAASNTAATAGTSTSARPRGRPPGSGGTYVRRARANAANADGQMKTENSPPLDGTRRVAKPKTTGNKPVEPWTATPEANRRAITSDDLSLLENGMFADATIIGIKQHEWKVHKTILCTRSKWFLDAFSGEREDGQTGVVNLANTEKSDVDTLLRFIYSGSLDKNEYGIEKCDFLTYAKIFKLGETFDLPALSDDALSLLGQYCDQKLVEICSYDVSQSGRHGIVDQVRGSPDRYMDKLFNAIRTAYDGVDRHTRLQGLLASFVWAGRDRLLRYDGFADFADECPRFGNDIFKLMLGQNKSPWLPSAASVHEMCTGFDHSRKTQHPDRCEKCDEVFDEDNARKALYNPFKVAVRAGAWCAPCVDKHPGPAPLWRMVVAEPEEEE